MADDGALQRFGEGLSNERGLLPEGRRSSDWRTWEQPRGCWEEKKEKKRKKIESDGSEGTGRFVRFGGPIAGSAGSIPAQPLYGPNGWTGPEW